MACKYESTFRRTLIHNYFSCLNRFGLDLEETSRRNIPGKSVASRRKNAWENYMYAQTKLLNHRPRKLAISSAPTKAKSREPAYSKALVRNKIDRKLK